MGYDSIEFGQASFSEGETLLKSARNAGHYAELRCRLPFGRELGSRVVEIDKVVEKFKRLDH
jgi:hypothetical protein